MKHPELAEQKLVARYLKALQVDGRILQYTATPIHYTSSMAQINKNMAAGVTKGFPDLIAITSEGKILFIEMKAKNGRISPEQKEWHKAIALTGSPCAVCYSAQEGINFINQHVQQPPKETQQERNKSADAFRSFIEGI